MLKKALSSIANAITGKKAEAPSKEQPQTEATVEPTGAWPFPGSPPEEKAAAPTTRKKRTLVKREEEPAAPVAKKTPKQIAAERRKAEAQKDQARAKKVKK